MLNPGCLQDVINAPDDAMAIAPRIYCTHCGASLEGQP